MTMVIQFSEITLTSFHHMENNSGSYFLGSQGEYNTSPVEFLYKTSPGMGK